MTATSPDEPVAMEVGYWNLADVPGPSANPYEDPATVVTFAINGEDPGITSMRRIRLLYVSAYFYAHEHAKEGGGGRWSRPTQKLERDVRKPMTLLHVPYPYPYPYPT